MLKEEINSQINKGNNKYKVVALRLISTFALITMVILYIVNILIYKLRIFEIQVRFFSYWSLAITLAYFIRVNSENIPTVFWKLSNSKINMALLSINFTNSLMFFLFVFNNNKSLGLIQYSKMSNHFYPLFFTLFYFSFNKVKLEFADIWLGPLVLVCYFPVNIFFSIIDQPVYPILDFYSVSSFAYLLGIILLAFLGGFLALLYQIVLVKLNLKEIKIKKSIISANIENISNDHNDIKNDLYSKNPKLFVKTD